METQKITFDQPLPTQGGMYLATGGGTYEHDKKQAISPVWVFDFRGTIMYVPMGRDRGQTIEEATYLRGMKWSRRLEVANPEPDKWREAQALEAGAPA